MLPRRPRPNKKLRYSVIALSTLSLTACVLNMKPEPPQSYQSFKQRRVPTENAAAENAVAQAAQQNQNQNTTLGQILHSNENPQAANANTNKPAQKPSMWSRLKNKLMPEGQGAQTAENPTPSANTAPRAVDSESEDGARRPMQNYGYTNTSSNESVKAPKNTFASMWDGLKGVFSNKNEEMPNATRVDLASKRTPIDNQIEMAQLGVSQTERFAQGSTAADGYSQYDLADEILSPTPVAEVKSHPLAQVSNTNPKPVLLASNTVSASAPLVDVQEAPSEAEIATKAETAPKPDLKTVPKAPKASSKVKVNSETTVYKANKKKRTATVKNGQDTEDTVAAKPEKEHKGTETSHLRRHSQRDDMEDVVIQDQSAKIIYKNGKPIVSGFIG